MNQFESRDSAAADAAATDAAIEKVLRGTAWAGLDDTFDALTADVFESDFCAAAAELLAANSPEQEQRALQAARRRHPSGRRRA